jgi:DeoR/GlpR family transcriptional regulator of sugar metabolism
VLADHTKWGSVGFATFANLSDANVVITDDGLTPDAIDILNRKVDEVLVVPSGLG